MKRIGRGFEVLVLSALLVSCGGQPGGGNNGQTTSSVIPAAGGSVSLEGIASVTFPPGAFTSDQKVSLETTADPATAQLFDLMSAIFAPGPRSAYEVRLNTGKVRPQGANLSVRLNVPQSLSVPAGNSVQAFAQTFEDGELALYDRFVPVNSGFDASSRSLVFDLPTRYLSNKRRSDQTFEVILLVSSTPTAQAGVSSLAAGPCPDGVEKIGPPLDVLNVRSRFDPERDNSMVDLPPGHFGTDFVATDGTTVRSVGEGKVVQAKESVGDGSNDNGGAGGTIVLEIPGSGRVQYMHLKKGTISVKVGDTVKLGQKIAEADNTGASTGSHLHFELKQRDTNQRIDPVPCIDPNKKLQAEINVTVSGSFGRSLKGGSEQATLSANWTFVEPTNVLQIFYYPVQQLGIGSLLLQEVTGQTQLDYQGSYQRTEPCVCVDGSLSTQASLDYSLSARPRQPPHTVVLSLKPDGGYEITLYLNALQGGGRYSFSSSGCEGEEEPVSQNESFALSSGIASWYKITGKIAPLTGSVQGVLEGTLTLNKPESLPRTLGNSATVETTVTIKYKIPYSLEIINIPGNAPKTFEEFARQRGIPLPQKPAPLPDFPGAVPLEPRTLGVRPQC